MTRYEYDPAGNVAAIIDPLENRTEFVYDDLDRIVEQIDPRGRSTTMQYDAVGNLTQRTDRNGRSTRFTYDDLYRVTAETWSMGGQDVRSFAYSHDAVGNLLSATDGTTAYSYSYDDLNRVLTEDNVGTIGVPHVNLTFAYDAAGNLISTTDNLGTQIASTYDGRNLLASRAWSGGGVDSAALRFEYNLRGGLSRIERFSDQAGTQFVGSSQFQYDGRGRLMTLSHKDAMSVSIVNYGYAYDQASRLLSESHHGETTTFSYDLVDQLTLADHSVQADETFDYDDNGNRMDTGVVIGPGNQVFEDGTHSYDYDNEGNLVRKTEIASGAYETFEYDHRNRLVRFQSHNAAGVVMMSVEYVYDVFDRRTTKTVDGVATYHIYAGQMTWADFGSSGSVVARYLPGSGVDQLLGRWRPGEGHAWYLMDHLGTVRDIINDNNSVVDHIEYGVFGDVISETNPASGDRFKYTGRELDAETNLYYYRARYYDPKLGKFISEDPGGFRMGDANLYRYVWNSPTHYTDPSGMTAVSEYAWDLLEIIGPLVASPYICLSNNLVEMQIGFSSYFFGMDLIPRPQSENLKISVKSCVNLGAAAWANGVFGEVAVLLELFNVALEGRRPTPATRPRSYPATGARSRSTSCRSSASVVWIASQRLSPTLRTAAWDTHSWG